MKRCPEKSTLFQCRLVNKVWLQISSTLLFSNGSVVSCRSDVRRWLETVSLHRYCRNLDLSSKRLSDLLGTRQLSLLISKPNGYSTVSNLRVLNLSDNQSLSAVQFQQLLSSLPNLQRVQLDRCTQLSDDSFAGVCFSQLRWLSLEEARDVSDLLFESLVSAKFLSHFQISFAKRISGNSFTKLLFN